MIKNLIQYILIFSVIQFASVHIFLIIPVLSLAILSSWIALIKGNQKSFDRIFLILLLSSNISSFTGVAGEIKFYTIHTIEILGISTLYFYLLSSALITLIIQKKSYLLYVTILAVTITGLVGGLVNASADEVYFIREFMILTSYLLALVIWYPRESERLCVVRDVLPILILARLLSAVAMSVMFGHYSIALGIIIFHNPAVPLMLLLAFTLSKKFSYLSLFSLALCVAILLLNFQKGFLVQYIFVSLCFFLFSKGSMRRVIPFAVLLTIALVPFASYFKELPTLDRINYELRSFQSVTGGLSPRAVEMKNIISRANEDFSVALLGGGLGSYFNERPFKFRSWQRNLSAFTQDELDSGRFYKPHTAIAWLILKFGFFGLIVTILFYINTIYRLYLSKQLEVVSISVLGYTFWILMQNVTVAIFSVIIFLAFTDKPQNEYSS